MDRVREMTGIYGLGFRRESVLGLIIPLGLVAFVAIVAFRDFIFSILQQLLGRG